jgi:hypothetical protein
MPPRRDRREQAVSGPREEDATLALESPEDHGRQPGEHPELDDP